MFCVKEFIMISVVEGNIFDSSCQAIVNTVNCVGVMGKSLAAQFKERYPVMFKDYVLRCDLGVIKTGKPYIYNLLDGRCIINFPTKNHWRDPSNIIWIEQGLIHIIENYYDWGITSIAFPALGVGCGQLIWEDVRTMMFDILNKSLIDIEIYKPFR